MFPPVRRTISTLAICLCIMSGITTPSWATTAETHQVRGSPGGPPDCSLGVASPRLLDGRLLARGSVYCFSDRAAYLRIRVRIQRLDGDVWIAEAGALGNTFAPSDLFLVRVSSLTCTTGRYRAEAVFRYRWSVEDRWTLFRPPLYSARRDIDCK
jgi:hypothetical protein